MDLDTLERLFKLRNSGALTEAEFIQQKQFLENPAAPASTFLPHQRRRPAIPVKSIFLGGAALATVLLIASLFYQPTVIDVTGATTSTEAESTSIDRHPGGTATALERKAYSKDLYDRPTGLSGQSMARYDTLPTEAQEYVDEKMAMYDAACARSNAC